MTCTICGKVHRGRFAEPKDKYGRAVDLSRTYVNHSSAGDVAHDAIILLEEAEELVADLHTRIYFGDPRYYENSADEGRVVAWLAKVRGE